LGMAGGSGGEDVRRGGAGQDRGQEQRGGAEEGSEAELARGQREGRAPSEEQNETARRKGGGRRARREEGGEAWAWREGEEEPEAGERLLREVQGERFVENQATKTVAVRQKSLRLPNEPIKEP